MRVTCPHCGEVIPSANINIQRMTAVCPACDNVFQFEAPAAKTKRRKVKQPEQLDLRETEDRLHLAFRTNFRLDQHEAFRSSMVMSLVFTFITLMMIGAFSTKEDVPLIMPGVFVLITAAMYYWTALIAYNKTHIDVDHERIKVTRQPLPSPFNQITEYDLAGIAAIRYEETPASRKAGYDTPRYRVWADMGDGGRKIILNDLIEEYALFVVQVLNERLSQEAGDEHLSHHLDDAGEALDEHEANKSIALHSNDLKAGQ